MAQLKIPKTFKLGNVKYRVEFAPNLADESSRLFGLFDPDENVIYLDEGVRDDKMGHTFCHELVHALLEAMGHELYEDEEFVDTFGLFLHQYLTTQYGKNKVLKNP